MSRRPIIAGNWKMNKDITGAKALIEELKPLVAGAEAGELRDEVEKLRKKGKLGSTKLSASNYETTSTGENVWLTTNNEKDS